MRNLAVATLASLFAISGMANNVVKGIVCTTDARQTGGDLRELMLVQGNDGFVMKHKVETGWFATNGSVEDAATGLVCNISQKDELAYCEATAADGTKNIAKIEQVKRAGLSSLEENSRVLESVVEATVKQGDDSKVKMYRFPAKACKLLKDNAPN